MTGPPPSSETTSVAETMTETGDEVEVEVGTEGGAEVGIEGGTGEGTETVKGTEKTEKEKSRKRKDPEVEVGVGVLGIKRVRRTKKREVIAMNGRVGKTEKLPQK